MIARREAKNFYYSFIALPPHKRDAMCAVYAFMRHADDLSDDESKIHAERRSDLQSWTTAWKAALAGAPTDNPVFVALADAQQRFAITTELLEQLVQGTAMDLAESAEPRRYLGFDTYPTFQELYQYCYYVASVVGLVCIRIFGYRDQRAEKFAEETGVAFQLTNILRDVREDAERGRIYLPLDDLARCGVTPEEIAGLKGGTQLAQAHRELLKITAERAHQYYVSADKLLPLINADSRPALWVLVTIYSRLLQRIEARKYDVFSERIAIPTWQKLAILMRGTLRTWMYRWRRHASSR